LVAPATSPARLESLASIADSFIYVVSRMGVTGSSANVAMSAGLPGLCGRVRKAAGSIPIAIGFGVSTREHFRSVGDLADGVVIGSKIVSLIKGSKPGSIEETIRNYCKEVSRQEPAKNNKTADAATKTSGETVNGSHTPQFYSNSKDEYQVVLFPALLIRRNFPSDLENLEDNMFLNLSSIVLLNLRKLL
jgi:Tryptophan synthase alpha chain